MINFVLVDAEGVVRQHGKCSQKEDLPQVEGMTVNVVDDDLGPVLPLEQNSYQDFRRMDYPTFGDQLDVLWRVMSKTEAFAADAEAQAMFKRIQNVKTQYPKQLKDT